MKNHILDILLLLSFLCSPIQAQKHNIQEGGYANHIELKYNSPSYKSKFEFRKLHNSRIPELYEVISREPTLDKLMIIQYIWAIYYDSTFYVNAKRLGISQGYIRILNFGKYCYFKGIPVKSIGQQERIKHSCCMFGLVGGFITASIISKKNKGRDHYILNIETGMVNVLTKSYMLRILEPFPDLYFSYNREEDQDSPPIQIEYINKVNEGIENQHNF